MISPLDSSDGWLVNPPEDGISGVCNIHVDSTCIFCGEKDKSFTDKGFDMHYWKNCPMLKRCAHCKQVVETAGLTDHMWTECDAKDTFAKAPAVPRLSQSHSTIGMRRNNHMGKRANWHRFLWTKGW